MIRHGKGEREGNEVFEKWVSDYVAMAVDPVSKKKEDN